jgi:hypothetical protein
VNKPDFCVLGSNLLSIYSNHVRIFHNGYVICLNYEFAVALRNSTPPTIHETNETFR